MFYQWFKPSARKVVKTIFSEFTPEEMKILESPDCAIPYMYTTLLKSFRPWHRSRYSLEEIKDLMDICIHPFRETITDPGSQQEIYGVFFHQLIEL